MCDGAQTESRPDFIAQSSSVRVPTHAEARVAVGEGPGRLLDGEEADAPLRLAPAAGCGAAGARQSTKGRPQAASASRQSRAAGQLRGEIDHARPERRLGGGRVDRPQAARLVAEPGPHDLDAERAGDAVELLDADEGAHRPGIGEAAGGDAFGEGLEQVDALGGELVLDRLGDGVVGDHLVDVVVLGGGVVRDLEHHVEADALGDPALGAEGADLHLAARSRAPRSGRAAGRRGSRSRGRAAARRRSLSRPCHPRHCPVVIAPEEARFKGAPSPLTLRQFHAARGPPVNPLKSMRRQTSPSKSSTGRGRCTEHCACLRQVLSCWAPGSRMAWTHGRPPEPADRARPSGPGAFRRGGAHLLERGPPPARARRAPARPGPWRGRRPITPATWRACAPTATSCRCAARRDLSQRMHRQSLEFRKAAENIAMDKVYRLLGRPISMAHQGCSFTYGDTKEPVPVHTYASLAQEVVARWLASPKHRASLLSRELPAARRRRGRRPEGSRLRRLLPGAELRRLSYSAAATCVAGAVEVVVPDRGGARHPARPAGADRAGVEVGRAVGDGARAAGEHQRGELLGARCAGPRSSSRPSCRRRRRRTGSRVPEPAPCVVTPQTVPGKRRSATRLSTTSATATWPSSGSPRASK